MQMQQKKLTHKITSYPPTLIIVIALNDKNIKIRKKKVRTSLVSLFVLLCSLQMLDNLQNKITKFNKNKRENQTKNKLKQNK